MTVTVLLLQLLLIPLLVTGVDLVGQVRVWLQGRRPLVVGPAATGTPDFTVVVPIYGNIAYLENSDHLHRYGRKVLLATGSDETPDFYAALEEVAAAHGFRVFRDTERAGVTERGATTRRAVGGTLRDRIVRDAHRVIDTPYVVCIDADTRTVRPLDELVRDFVAGGWDLASVRLVVANRQTLLGRLQAHEYAMAMRLRRIMPWMVSGACHIGRSAVHRDLMQRHSLFFQGNDVELGLLAVAGGYTVGHLPFEVPTAAPDTLRGWWRQRVAWAGGEFRLMVVNLRLAVRHPFLWAYGLIVVLGLLPWRWAALVHPRWSLLVVLAVYLLVVVGVNWRTRSRALLVYPLYALVYSAVVVPIGVWAYVRMALRYRNAGIIRPHARVSAVAGSVLT